MRFEIDAIERVLDGAAELAEPAGGNDSPSGSGLAAGVLAEPLDLLVSPAVPQPPPAIELLGRHVRRARRLTRITQDALAARSGVSQSAISRLEAGRGGPLRADRLVSIGSELGRALPLGYCPHEHRCLLQPLVAPPPRDESEKMRELLVSLGLDLPFRRWWSD
jgi:transcriptional regulator with XRE-family HTH domain